MTEEEETSQPPREGTSPSNDLALGTRHMHQVSVVVCVMIGLGFLSSSAEPAPLLILTGGYLWVLFQFRKGREWARVVLLFLNALATFRVISIGGVDFLALVLAGVTGFAVWRIGFSRALWRYMRHLRRTA